MKLHNRIKLWAVEKYRVLHGCPRDMDEERFDAGFSLLESLVSIVVFALVITAVGSSLVMAHRINARSEVLMQEQLKVSRAVEGIMASGIDRTKDDTDTASEGSGLMAFYQGEYGVEIDEFDESGNKIGIIYDPIIEVTRGELEPGVKNGAFYKVVVKSTIFPTEVSVTTYVRPAEGGNE